MRCLIVMETGGHRIVDWTERELASFLENDVTFLGVVEELQLVIAGNRKASTPHCWGSSALFPEDEVVRGPLVFVGSDAQGEAMDVDVQALKDHLFRRYRLTCA